MRIYVYAFCRKFGKMSQIRVSRGVHPDYYDITKGRTLKFIAILQGGGLPDLLQYYNGGGVSQDPKFVLRNIWTAPNTMIGTMSDNRLSEKL